MCSKYINFWSFDRLLKNVNILQVETGKNPTTPSYIETKKWNFLKKNVTITKWANASSYDVEILTSFNPELQLKDSESAIKNRLTILTELTEFKFMTTLVLVTRKIESDDKTKYDTFYSHSKAEIIINKSDIDDVFQSIYTKFISNIQKSSGKDSS